MEIIDYDVFKAYMTRIQSISNYTLINDIHNSLLYQRDIISEFLSENPDLELPKLMQAKQQLHYFDILILEIRLRIEAGAYDEQQNKISNKFAQ